LDGLAYEVAYSSTSAAEPLSYSEALRRPDAEQWKQAALEELNAHSTNGTWELVPRPKGKKIIGSKWVFKVKRNADGSVERYNFSCRQCNNALQLRRPGDSISANLNKVATSRTSCVFTSTMISIRVCAEQLGAGRVR